MKNFILKRLYLHIIMDIVASCFCDSIIIGYERQKVLVFSLDRLNLENLIQFFRLMSFSPLSYT
jgi:hypothetical protein